MDFLDPKKRRARAIQLYVGYALVAIAIIVATTILLYQAYGFGLDKNGQVTQKGLVYFSSQPAGADIYINGTREATTNTRLNILSGRYDVVLKRTGYRNWQRQVAVTGGMVMHYDYPFLFPIQLTTKTTQTLEVAPVLVTQSPDHRWLITATAKATELNFTQHDLNNPQQAATTLALPTTIAVVSPTQDSWTVVDWANDNRHILMRHNFNNTYEFILVDRETPASSVNLTKLFGGVLPDIQLQNKQYDSYVVYDAASQALSTATLKTPTLTVWASHVAAYQTYATDTVLYATTQDTEAGKAQIMLRQGDKTYPIRTVPAGSQYLLNLTKYSGDWIVAAGAANEDKVYVYVNPVATLQATPSQVLVPVSVLKVTTPNYLAFSSNTRFIMAEHGNSFSVYDAETDKTYTYTATATLDAPQVNARWMDGHRLSYISGGKLVVIDFDNANPQTLMVADAHYVPFFSADYRYVYTMSTDKDSKPILTNTALRTPSDL